MARFFEVLSQNDANLEPQTQQQFFSGNSDERTQVRYILADGTPQQFETQQLILSGDQVMVLDRSQQQIQSVVIHQQPFQSSPQRTPQQFNAVVQTTNMNNQQQQPQIFYMDSNSNPGREGPQTAQTAIEQNPSPTSSQGQPIVLNHQINSSSPNMTNRANLQGNGIQRPVLHIRTPSRQGLVQQINQPTSRPVNPNLRQGMPQQGSRQPPHLSTTIPPRNLPPQVSLRVRTNLPQNRPQIQQPQMQLQQPPRAHQLAAQLQQSKAQQLASLNRQLNALNQQQKQSAPQQVTQTTPGVQQQQHNQQEELDDHTGPFSTPGQMVHKMLEQRKNPILARLPSNIKITTAANSPSAQAQASLGQSSTVSQTIDDVISQVHLQQPPATTQGATVGSPNPHLIQNPPVQQAKKPRAPPRSKNQANAAVPKGPAKPRNQRNAARPSVETAAAAQPRGLGGPNTPRVPMQQPMAGPRFPQNQPPSRFSNQPPMPPQPHQPSPMTNGQPPVNNNEAPRSNQSQMNYLITPPTPNKPRQQQPLPAYIASSQIQQIIGMFKESTPITDEFSDSIRMLVLLENGEQRLITFTLPKEACTIQEILEQVNVPFTLETNIQVTEANTNGINYIVTVGNVQNFVCNNNSEDDSAERREPEPQPPQQQQHVAAEQQMPPNAANRPPYPQKPPPLVPTSQVSQAQPTTPPEPAKPPTPELPRLVPGKLAVCNYCGYTGEDFNKCTRCTRKLPPNVRSIENDSPKADNNFRPSLNEIRQIPSSNGFIGPVRPPNITPAVSTGSPVNPKPESTPKQSPVKKRVTKPKGVDNESVVISSDEEEDEKKPAKSVSEQLLNKLGASISISPITKEPSLTEIKKHTRKTTPEPAKCYKLPLKCRTVRIGSYRFIPGDDVILDSKCVIIKAPALDNKNEFKTIRIDRGDIVKVLVCFNKVLPVIFFYLNVGAAPIIRDMLNLTRDSGLYFDPIEEKEDSYRKITILPDDIIDEHKIIFEKLYSCSPYNIMDELTAKEANDILIKSCPRESVTGIALGSLTEIKQILMYPKEGTGRISINTEDYLCLGNGQFINDKIIDFYLKYIWDRMENKDKIHIFSTFFYKRLTTKPTRAARKSHPYETDTTLSAAEKRHYRVKNWTKRINLFEKDFIVVPINENAHWFLAIICFPNLRGAQTFSGEPYQPVKPEPRKAKKKSAGECVTVEIKKEKPVPIEDALLSDKDEADSDSDAAESDVSEESSVEAAATAAAIAAAAGAAASQPTPATRSKRPPIKQPCILVFDSLAGPSRSRVVATLRDYLTVEYKVKMDTERLFNKDTIRGSIVKVPQQNNFTDCGLYVLQYVEQFFKDPLKDFNIPIKGIEDWFEEIIVTKKREDICILIKQLMEESGADVSSLPDIALPTLKGKLIETQEPSENTEEEPEDMFTDIEDSEMIDASSNSLNQSRLSEENSSTKIDDSSSMGDLSSQGSFQSSPVKPSDCSVGEKSDIVATPVQSASLKPTLSEFPRQASNKDTLNYLKSKRIVRHKSSNEGPEFKKSKHD